MTEVTHEVDGIDFDVDPILFDAGTASTMVGGTVKGYAVNVGTGILYSCVGSVLSATKARVTWASSAVPFGDYLVQVLGTPAGYAPQTIYEGAWQVKKSLGPA